MDTENQPENNLEETLDEPKEKKSRVTPLLPYQWKKGQSGNPAGRPKGKTMKEYVRELLERQTDEERQEFLQGMPKEIIWKMAEGNPQNNTDLTSKGEALVIIPPEKAEQIKNALQDLT